MTTMADLDREARLNLMKFVCSFAWTDLDVDDEERDLVQRMAESLGFDEKEREQIAQWLEVPPTPEEVDPADIPAAHRHLFYKAAQGMVASDGRLARSERDSLALFRELLD